MIRRRRIRERTTVRMYAWNEDHEGCEGVWERMAKAHLSNLPDCDVSVFLATCTELAVDSVQNLFQNPLHFVLPCPWMRKSGFWKRKKVYVDCAQLDYFCSEHISDSYFAQHSVCLLTVVSEFSETELTAVNRAATNPTNGEMRGRNTH